MLTVRKLWAGLSQEGQETVCFHLAQSWKQLTKGNRHALAQAISFRERTLETTQVSRRASLLQRSIPRLGRRDLAGVLFSLINIRENLAREFNKAVSDLDISDDAENAEDQIKDCIDRLTGRWSVEDLWLHAGLVYISSSADGPAHLQEKIFTVLEKARPKISSILSSSTEDDTQESQEPIESLKQKEEDLPEFRSPDFTTLDKVLIRTVVSSLNRVKGYLSLDELDDLVGELIELNDSRERSWFHRGFVDSLLERKLQESQSGDNPSRRAWYVTGYIVASMRTLPESDRPDFIERLSQQDIELLKDTKNQSAVQFLPILLKPLLEKGQIEEANNWIAAHGKKRFFSVVMIVLQWASERLISEQNAPGKIRSVLDTVGNFFPDVYDIQTPNIDNIDPKFLDRLNLDIRYLRAISFRMEGLLKSADIEFKNLINEEEFPARKKDLWVQRALVQIGIRSLVDLNLHSSKEKRDNFINTIMSTKKWLEKAIEGKNPSPIALVLMALPDVASLQNQKFSNAKENLDRAIDIMQQPGVQLWESGGGSLGEETHLLNRARFYSILLDLRTGDALQAEGQSLVTRLQDLLENDKFPPDLEIEAVDNALIIEAPGAAELAAIILNRHGHKALNILDIVEASKESPDFRTNLIEILDDDKWIHQLKPDERWNAWFALLQGCNASHTRDIENAQYALDSLQKLAHKFSPMSNKFVALLEDDKDNVWSPAWEEEDRDDARYQCYIDQRNFPQALNILNIFANRAITENNHVQVKDLLELVSKHDSEGDILKKLTTRYQNECVQDDEQSDDLQIISTDTNPISIIFVGGNEKQRKCQLKLDQELKNEDPYIQVFYHFTDWSSNWPNTVTKISNQLLNADCLVILKFMRTGLGIRLRRMADEHGKFWMPCTGHGLNSMKRSILKAAELVRQQRNKPSA